MGENSAYTVEEVDTEGAATIITYEVNKEIYELTPHYYKFTLKQDFGEVNAENRTPVYYKWEEQDGITTLVEGTESDHDIIYWKDSTLNYNRITGDLNGADINHGFTGIHNNTSGGAIYNSGGTIGNITGDFINNSVDNNSAWANYSGGAIYNYSGTIGDITGDFINNSATGSGGAIQNRADSTIGIITGDFINNSANTSGGAIDNGGSSSIEAITGDFINNSANTSGGAIDNVSGTIGDITGNFINNSANTDGGAIDNVSGTIGDITGNFINNSANTDGGAIYSGYGSIIGNITGDFINNSANRSGGAIYNTNQIGDITGDFIYNSANTGGAIYNVFGTIGDITGDFINNSANSLGGAIYNTNTIGDITGNFINNSANSLGGAIYNNRGVIGDITGDFINNSVISSDTTAIAGGAIANDGLMGKFNAELDKIQMLPVSSIINNKTGENVTLYPQLTDEVLDELQQYLEQGYKFQVVPQYAYVDMEQEEFEYLIKEYEQQKGYSAENTYEKLPEDAFVQYLEDSGIVNSSFINNHVDAPNGEAMGGAIFIGSFDQKIIAKDGYTSVISGNYVQDKNGKRDEAIYVLSPAVTLEFAAKTNGKFIINDKINGTEGYTVKFSGDNTGAVQLNNNIQGKADVELNDITLHLAARDDVLNGNNFIANSGTLNMINGQVNAAALNNVTVNGNTNMLADVDLANKQMDRITASSYGKHKGNINVAGINLISDAKDNRTEILFAEQGLKDNVTTGVTTTENNPHQLTAYTPIYKYNVSYDNRDDAGYMLFVRGGAGSGGNPSEAFNPAVLNSPVSSLAAGQATINETFKYTFEHADAFTQLPAVERISKIKQNYYALSTDYNENLGVLAPEFHNKAGWVRPYVTFESMNLKNGPDVDAITYGTLVGFDSDFQKLKNGWYGVTTGYVGYNGSQLNYSGNDTSMNGGLLGVTQTFYKGNFWTALTASAGASVGETSNMYGTDDFVSLLAGVGSKTGYNFEFKEGKFILQPIMFLSYTFVNTFDYTNAAGVKIESDPLHTIQLNPSIRFIANLENFGRYGLEPAQSDRNYS